MKSPIPLITPNPDEPDDLEPPAAEDFYYILQTGKIAGPFTVKKIVELAMQGAVKRSDFVQIAGQAEWKLLPEALDPAVPPPDGTEPAPAWKTIAMWAWLRLRYNLGERSLAVGWMCLGAAVACVFASQFHASFWSPALLLSAASGIILCWRRRFVAGFLLLAAAAPFPWLASRWLALFE